MNFPVFSLNNRELGFRDEFAPDYLLQERVTCEPGDQDRRREGGDSSAASRALRSISDRARV
jgi:hypothetical protein